MVRKDFRALTEWFFENYIKPKKCHICIGRNTENDKFELDKIRLKFD